MSYKLRLETIRYVHQFDNSQSIDYLGEWRDRPDKEFNTVDNGIGPDLSMREYRFFVAANVEDAQQAYKNYNRVRALSRGEWYFIGIYVKAELVFENEEGGGIVHSVRTPGVWGIESDGDKGYLSEIRSGQLETLIDMLSAMGISQEQIEQARVAHELRTTGIGMKVDT